MIENILTIESALVILVVLNLSVSVNFYIKDNLDKAKIHALWAVLFMIAVVR